MKLLAAAMLSCAAFAGQPVKVILGGDVNLGRHVYVEARRQRDMAWPFRRIADTLRDADVTFVNLESPFAPAPPYFEDRMVFRAHPSMVAGLSLAGVDLVSTANNHSRDAGAPGIAFTVEHLQKNGILAVGTTQNDGAILERKGTRIGFLAYTFDQRNGNHTDEDPRVAMMDPASIGRSVRALRSKCDAVIVSMHAGIEYHPRPDALQVRFARAAIDAGAAVVVGHHPHTVQPVEQYKDGVIFYSLGNLVFDQPAGKVAREGAIAEVEIRDSRLSSFRLRDVVIRHTVPSLRASK